MFTPPRWLRDLGRTAWLLVGMFLLLAGLTWLLGATNTIVGPLLAASIVATVSAPIVSQLASHRIPRAAGAAIVVLAAAVLAAVIAIVVIGGVTSQTDAIGTHASEAADKAQSWLESLGVDHSGTESAKSSV